MSSDYRCASILDNSTSFQERATAGEPFSEVRTFLIADLRGYTAFTHREGDEAAAHVSELFLEISHEVIELHSGWVFNSAGDQTLAAFSSARQALKAALALQARLADEQRAHPSLPFHAGIGLDSGEAIRVGNDYRGGAINLAARLCALAGPDEVLASEGVVHLARRMEGLRFFERGRTELKGFPDPVGIIQVMAEGSASAPVTIDDSPPPSRSMESLAVGGYIGALPASPLIGRDRELERALRAVVGVEEAHGQMVLFGGEAWVGKTRLVQEIALELHRRGFILATGRCYEQQEGVPYYPFLDALETLYRSCSPHSRTQAPARWPVLGRLIPELDLPSPASGADGAEEQQRLFRAVAGFLGLVATEVPVALILDDLHWSDAASVDLLQHICRHTRRDRVLLLAIYRDVATSRRSGFDGMLRDLGREQLLEIINLSRLDQAATAALVSTAISDSAQRPKFVDFIYRRTEGNPFFVQQLVNDLMERGVIGGDDARWLEHTTAAMQVPEGIRSVIGQRLARLNVTTQEILRAASVLGQTFHFDDLQSIAGYSEVEIEAALDEGEKGGLVREVGTDQYAFDHALTQAALYVDLPGRRRRKLHGLAAESIEAWPERRRAVATTQLAWHYMHAGQPEEAFPYVLAAGDEARTSFAYADAERQFHTALELAEELDDDGRRREALLQRAGMYRDTYRGRLAVDDCTRALALTRAARDERGELQAILDLARSHYVVALDTQEQDATRQCREQYEAAIGLAERLGDTPCLIQALLETRWLQDFWPDYVPVARANRERALLLSLETEDEDLIIRSKLSLIRTRSRAEAETWGADLERRLTARGDLRRLNELHYHLMWANLQWGQLERCVAHCDAGFQLAAHIGVPPVQYGSLKALALIGLGRYSEALDALQTEVSDDDHPFGRACRDLGLAYLQLDLLAYEQAAETSRDVIQQARRISRQWIEEMAQESLALALLHGGKPDQINADPAIPPSTMLAAEIFLARGEFEAALQRSRAAAEEAWAAEHVSVSVAAGEISARVLLALERWDEVVALCTDTLAVARHHGYRPMIWRLEVHRATALKRCGRHDEAEESRQTAFEAIRELASNTSDVGLRRAFMTNTTIRSVVEGT